MKMRNEVLDEISNIGKSLIKIAEYFKTDEAMDVKQEEQAKQQEPVISAETSTACTLTDLKKAFFALSEKGMDSAAVTLLAEFGYSKLSQVAEKDYAALKQKAEDITHA